MVEVAASSNGAKVGSAKGAMGAMLATGAMLVTEGTGA
jgi:hypothetical protein